MYIAIYVGETKESFIEPKTLSEVLEIMLKAISEGKGSLDQIVVKYNDKEKFIEDLDNFMDGVFSAYVIGVDVDEDTFEILHIKYEWVIRDTIPSEN